LAGCHRLGAYEILALLGSGGMGEVYRARDPKLNRAIAIKILPETAADPERRARFEREAQTIAALNHPNIVTIHSVEEDNGVLFLTMELVEGKGQYYWNRRTGQTLLRAIEYFQQAIDKDPRHHTSAMLLTSMYRVGWTTASRRTSERRNWSHFRSSTARSWD
jgi:serine/threonine protein kinase